MTKKLLLPLLIIQSLMISAQTKTIDKKDFVDSKSENVIQNKNKDTIKAILKTKPSVFNIAPNNKTQIILVKEENNATDWAKYALPILTLFLGIFINRLIDWLNKRKTIIRNGERWIVELRSTQDPIIEQIASLEKFKSEVTTIEFKPTSLSAMTAINGEVFKSLNKNDLIKYIEIKNTLSWYKKPYWRNKEEKENSFSEIVKISNRTHGHISIMAHQFNMIQERYNAYLTGTSKHTTSFTKNLQLFLTEYRTYNLSFELAGQNLFIEPKTSPIVTLFTQYIVPNIKDGKYNPFLLKDSFFMSIITHCATYRLDARTIPLGTAVTACLNDIAGLTMEVTYIHENIDIFVKRYNELITELNPLIDEILHKKI